jgi:hypothetical protein
MFAKWDRPVLSCLKIRSRICRLYDIHGSCANVFPLMSQLPSRFGGGGVYARSHDRLVGFFAPEASQSPQYLEATSRLILHQNSRYHHFRRLDQTRYRPSHSDISLALTDSCYTRAASTTACCIFVRWHTATLRLLSHYPHSVFDTPKHLIPPQKDTDTTEIWWFRTLYLKGYILFSTQVTRTCRSSCRCRREGSQVLVQTLWPVPALIRIVPAPSLTHVWTEVGPLV